MSSWRQKVPFAATESTRLLEIRQNAAVKSQRQASFLIQFDTFQRNKFAVTPSTAQLPKQFWLVLIECLGYAFTLGRSET
jgi:hypothetical protein